LADFVLDEDVSEALQSELERLNHDVLTTRNLRSKGTEDEAQLSMAVHMDRIFVTRPRHPGILLIPQSPLLPTPQAAIETDALLFRRIDVSNRLFALHPSRGWEQIG
jgi:hypothetical protein